MHQFKKDYIFDNDFKYNAIAVLITLLTPDPETIFWNFKPKALKVVLVEQQQQQQIITDDTVPLASWVERETIYLWLWPLCAWGGRKFPVGRDTSVGGVFHLAKIFSTKYAIYSKFI